MRNLIASIVFLAALTFVGYSVFQNHFTQVTVVKKCDCGADCKCDGTCTKNKNAKDCICGVHCSCPTKK